MDEDEARKPRPNHQIGQDLSLLSVDEIDNIIGELAAEIERLSEAREQKSSHLSAAEQLFKK